MHLAEQDFDVAARNGRHINPVEREAISRFAPTTSRPSNSIFATTASHSPITAPPSPPNGIRSFSTIPRATCAEVHQQVADHGPHCTHWHRQPGIPGWVSVGCRRGFRRYRLPAGGTGHASSTMACLAESESRVPGLERRVDGSKTRLPVRPPDSGVNDFVDDGLRLRAARSRHCWPRRVAHSL